MHNERECLRTCRERLAHDFLAFNSAKSILFVTSQIAVMETSD